MLFLGDQGATGRVGDVAEAETERWALNDGFRGGRGGTLVDDMLWGGGGLEADQRRFRARAG